MTSLTERVAAALARSVLSTVIARGAAVRVAGVEDRVVTLEVTGSPGAVLPLTSRIEAQLRAAVPDLLGIRIVTPGAQPLPADARPRPAPPTDIQPLPADAGPLRAPPAGVQAPPTDAEPPAAESLVDQARRVLDGEVNPAIAAHRGRVVLAGADEGWVRVRLEGGCQGCSLAEVTVRQGIEPLLRARLPGLVGVLDVTDHEAGTQPFFSPEKR